MLPHNTTESLQRVTIGHCLIMGFEIVSMGRAIFGPESVKRPSFRTWVLMCYNNEMDILYICLNEKKIMDFEMIYYVSDRSFNI